MGRHRMQTATPGEDEQETPAPSWSLSDLLARRRTVVLRTAAGVVSVLALGGVVTVVRGFTPADRPECAAGCAGGRTDDAAGARTSAPSATPSHTSPVGTASPRHDRTRTFTPTTVTEPKRREPRVTSTPGPPTDFPRPPGHPHWPGHGHWPW